jgi:hypothetical protein
MKPVEIQPVLNEAALIVKEKRMLVIADLHIGIESELREKGLQAPSQTVMMTKRIQSLCIQQKSKDVIILGDIKHNIPSSSFEERKDVKRFLDEITSLGTIHIIPGNHDGNIRKLLPSDVKLHSSGGLMIDDIGFVHGHRLPHEEIMQCDHVIVAHTHPTIMLMDRLGYKTYESCWVRGKCKKNNLLKQYPAAKNPEIIIVPAFHPLCGGIAINHDPILGPFGKIVDVHQAMIYLLDGSFLGKVKDIK